MKPKQRDLITILSAAQILNASRHNIKSLVDKGKFAVTVINGVRFVSRKEITAYSEQHA